MTDRLFISYSRGDQNRVLELVRRLKERGASVWIDQRSIDGAHLWSAEIVDAIEECKAVILFLSATAVQSHNIVKEVQIASECRKPILPVYLERTEIPRELRYPLAGIQHIDAFQDDNESVVEAIVRSLTSLNLTLKTPLNHEVQKSSKPIDQVLMRFRSPEFVYRRQSLVDDAVEKIRIGSFSHLIIQGLAGIGKTTLFCDILRALHSEYPLICAVSLDGPAALEPGYLLEGLNSFLNECDRGLDAGLLETLKPERALELLLPHFMDLQAVLAFDAIDRVEGNWLDSVIRTLSIPPGVQILTTTRSRPKSASQSYQLAVGPLSAAESLEFVEQGARAFDIDVEASDLVSRLPGRIASHPHALTTLLGQLVDFPLDLLLTEGLADIEFETRRLVVSSLSSIEASERRVLAFVALIGDNDLQTARQILQVEFPDGLLSALKRLLSRSLAQRTGPSYTIPELVVEALAEMDRETIKSIAGEVVKSWQTAISSNLAANEAALAASLGARIGHTLRAWQMWDLLSEVTTEENLESLNVQGFWKEYSLLLQIGIEAADQLADQVQRVRLGCRLSRKLKQMGDLVAARAVIAECESLIPPGDESLAYAEILSHRVFLYEYDSEPEKALAELAESRRIRAAVGDRQGQAVVDKLIGHIHLRRREHQEGRNAYARALEILADMDATKEVIEIETSLALCDLSDNDNDAAESRLRAAINQCETTGYRAGLPRAFLNLALTLAQKGQSVEALELAQQSSRLAAETDRSVATTATMLAGRIKREMEF